MMILQIAGGILLAIFVVFVVPPLLKGYKVTYLTATE